MPLAATPSRFQARATSGRALSVEQSVKPSAGTEGIDCCAGATDASRRSAPGGLRKTSGTQPSHVLVTTLK